MSLALRDRFIAAAGYWTVLGLYADLAWHIRHHVDTFFTAQHAILYSGLVVLLIAALLVRRARDMRTTFFGIILFAAGGAADLAKHQLFGIEHDFDALVSPTHLLIGFGVAVAIGAPLRRDLSQLRTLAAQLPAIVALAMLVELLHWVTNPLFRLNAANAYATSLPHQLTTDALTLQTLRVYEQAGGVVAALLGALLIAAPLVFLARALRPAPGAYTIFCVFSVLFVALSSAASPLEALIAVCAAAIAGIAADVVVRRSSLALLATASALAYNGALIGLTALLQSTWWDASFAVGTVLLSAAFAWFLTPLVRAADPTR